RALLFENNGTRFPVLINAFGSDRRIAMALGMNDLSKAGNNIEKVFDLITDSPANMMEKIMALPRFLKITGYLPALSGSRGSCQQNICLKPDLSILPVLKCWPHDGGRFITLPMVHTIHPVTGRSNVGMYRMQILGSDSTGMHWQRHKTGANHFDSWKATGKRMPVSVTLGGDPVYTYCATAPLPENISEYILAGFLRKKKVKLVKCITNDIYVPSDADIVIEGYVDPAEEFVSEGPFGDHTGFYSLSDLYPVFHVTCITHSEGAVYPATIVGVPPHEDAWLAKATEKIFLSPVRLAIQPEILDFHMPEAGVAHNLVVVRINKSYPGQGMKVINSLFGAGQMMFTKYLIVVSGTLDIRNYKELMIDIFTNTDFGSDILFTRGPLDVLDHSSDNFSFGGKAGVDATVKLPEEMQGRYKTPSVMEASAENYTEWLNGPFIKGFRLYHVAQGIIILILAVDPSEDPGIVRKVCDLLKKNADKSVLRLVIAVDHTVDRDDLFMVVWQVLGNSDPGRDHYIISPDSLLIDGTIKFYREGGFPRRWPNIVCSDAATIEKTDKKWDSLGFETFINSPSLKYMKLTRNGTDTIVTA
ncbi:MAG: menaquinone biosynthesis decarboxylase, partial [Bacteroidia bacterium]|nr:menaquinone biosynthesis decarboxylase [Bacteroidia bacterium]